MSRISCSVAVALALLAITICRVDAAERQAYPVSAEARAASLTSRAERGDAAAQARLGWMYSTGRGVPQNYFEAAKWYYRAADQGDPGAQLALGLLYNKGEGVRRDYILAYLWLNLSAAQVGGSNHDFAARLRDAVAGKMTPRQMQIAQSMALEWYKSR
jgi:uncharacterized protein